MQVGDWAPASINTINASTVLVLVEQHKLEQDAATGMQVAKLLLHLVVVYNIIT